MGKTKKEKTQVKKRSPVLSALLSLMSLGLGQVYNGELRKGILLKVTFLLTICLYAFLSFKVTHDLLLLLFLVCIFVLLKVAGPFMVVALVVGLAIALFQALTQVQEITLVFVPKIFAIFITLLILLPFMGATLSSLMVVITDRIVSG